MYSREHAMPKVSVIMPVYNGADYLAAAIESVLGQSYTELELIVIDDCSTDGSALVVQYFSRDSRVIYIKNDVNSGASASRNNGIRRATGDLIAFLDHDDIWLAEKLELQVNLMIKHAEMALVHSDMALMTQQGGLLPKYRNLDRSDFLNFKAPVIVGFVFGDLFICNYIQILTVVVRRSVLDQIGLFNESLSAAEDYELWLRIARRHPIGYCRTIVAKYRVHEGQMSSNGYAMLLSRLEALNCIIASGSNVESLVGEKPFIKRMHSLNRGAGNYYFYNKCDYRVARSFLVEAIKLKPLDIGTFIKIIYCTLPVLLRDSLRHIKNVLR
jgi:glycosyltransferase involved in cell wall biosynthesis